jgi:hypothetical protein
MTIPVVQAHILYNEIEISKGSVKKSILSQVEFQDEIIKRTKIEYLDYLSNMVKRRKRAICNISASSHHVYHPAATFHYPICVSSNVQPNGRLRRKKCRHLEYNKDTKWKCTICDIYLCIDGIGENNCFFLYHTTRY